MTIMSYVSLPLFEGFNSYAIWPSQHPVSDYFNVTFKQCLNKSKLQNALSSSKKDIYFASK